MYLALITLTIPILILILTRIFHVRGVYFADGNDFSTASIVWSVIIAAVIIINVAVNMSSNATQINSYMEIEMHQNERNIYLEKSNNLSEIFQNALLEKYPTHEKEIFGGMSTEDLQMLFVKYPEIKASLTSINYVDKIESLQNDIFDCDLIIQRKVKECQFRLKNPWIFHSLIKSPPDNLQHYFH